MLDFGTDFQLRDYIQSRLHVFQYVSISLFLFVWTFDYWNIYSTCPIRWKPVLQSTSFVKNQHAIPLKNWMTLLCEHVVEEPTVEVESHWIFDM